MAVGSIVRSGGPPGPPAYPSITSNGDARRAGWLMWLAFWTMFVSVGIGLSWDASWHSRNRFETAFSPPHLFIYVTTGAVCGLYLLLLTARRLRVAFGPGFAVPGVAFRVPGPLALIGAGLGILALGAMLDVVWHTAFGLDETRWSTPHAMLGWGWSLAAFGFVSARLALWQQRPLRWWTRALLAMLLLWFSVGPILGPFQNNLTFEKVAAIAQFPVLLDQPEFQHTARIYRDWHIVRSHPLFVVLGALWFGVALHLLWMIDRRAVFVLAMVGLWTLVTLAQGRATATRLGLSLAQSANWMPIPLLPSTVAALAVGRFRPGPMLAAAVGGIVFGIWSQLTWPAVGIVVGALLGASCAVAGQYLGSQLATALVRPTRTRCAVMAAVSVLTPCLTGLADLYMRARTPWG